MGCLLCLKPSRELVNAVTTVVRMDPSPHYGDVVNAVVATVLQFYQSEFEHLSDPKNYREAMRSPDKKLWERAEQNELTYLRPNNT